MSGEVRTAETTLNVSTGTFRQYDSKLQRRTHVLCLLTVFIPHHHVHSLIALKPLLSDLSVHATTELLF